MTIADAKMHKTILQKKKYLVISSEQTRLSERLISKVKGEMAYGFHDK